MTDSAPLFRLARLLNINGAFNLVDEILRMAIQIDDKTPKGGAAWITDSLPPGLKIPGFAWSDKRQQYWTKDPSAASSLQNMATNDIITTYSGNAGNSGNAVQPPQQNAYTPSQSSITQIKPVAPVNPVSASGLVIESSPSDPGYWWIKGLDAKLGEGLGMTFSPRQGGRFGTRDQVLAGLLKSLAPSELNLDSILNQMGRSKDKNTAFSLKQMTDPMGNPLWVTVGNSYDHNDLLHAAGFKFVGGISKTWQTNDPQAVQNFTDALNNPQHPLQQVAKDLREKKNTKSLTLKDGSYSDRGYDEAAHRQSYAVQPKKTQNIPVPELLSLDPYQQASAEFIMERDGALLFDAPGVGKTAPAIVVLNSHPEIKKVLIVCTASLKEIWRNQLLGNGDTPTKGKPETVGWLTNRDRSVGIATPSKLPTTDILIINYDLLDKYQQEIYSQQWDYVVIDESHKIKNPKTKWTQVLNGDPRNQKVINGIPRKKAVTLTGTPSPNAVQELWSQVHFAAPALFGDRNEFVDTFCEVKPIRKEITVTDPVTKQKENKMVTVRQIVGMKNIELLNRILFGGGTHEPSNTQFQGLAMRRTLDDIGDLYSLPPLKKQMLEVDNPHDITEIANADKALKEHTEFHKDEVASDLPSAANKEIENLQKKISTVLDEYDAKIAQAESIDDMVNMEKKYFETINSPAFEEFARYRQLTGFAKINAAVQRAMHYLNKMEHGKLNKVIISAVHIKVIDEIAARLGREIKQRNLNSRLEVVYGSTDDEDRNIAFSGIQKNDDVHTIIISSAAKEGVTLTGANKIIIAELPWTPGDLAQIIARGHRRGQERDVTADILLLKDSLDGRILKKISNKTHLERTLLDHRL